MTVKSADILQRSLEDGCNPDCGKEWKLWSEELFDNGEGKLDLKGGTEDETEQRQPVQREEIGMDLTLAN